jgi:hypothetical protein
MGEKFYQIHQDGQSVDRQTYLAYEGVCAQCQPRQEVVEIDVTGNVLRHIPDAERQKAAKRFRNPAHAK